MEEIGLYLLKALMSLVAVGSLILIPIGLPGNWVVVGLAFAGPWMGTTWTSFFVILGAAVLAEICEFFGSIAVAKKSGAGKAGLWGAVLGGIAGGILMFPLFPPFGPILGSALGSFIGAVVLELALSGRSRQESLKAGFGAFLGSLLGKFLKFWLGIFQVVWWLLALWGWIDQAPPPEVPVP